ncbi:hypothetical protein A2V49_03590 [candidate division WWE3 bacterium RBG_19FT_COMBO_34_6]|uniref:Metallo-beta-lactamase domain-containing protein n=1 Tax=candidate division WWE3 bacterium RBG_19FT_COMBO_34_6 TaxID=1802612 RepID=A0A1F4UMY5_UNCKA|nr:MAG: hypothetical protein A2V49_03590 [candidate division WWE3 bacterium RBG_19FT_COMBO_34_6]
MKFLNTKNKEQDLNEQDVLKFISIGDGVTKNLAIYEYNQDIIAVDYGIGFPEGDDYGVDFLIPDMTYLLENSHKVKGLFISHAHADHFAAVPYLLQELNVPIYASKLTQAYIQKMLEEKQFKSIKDGVRFHLFDSTTEEVTVGVFKVSAFNVNHSVPSSLGIKIDTPQGRIIHMADFKIDMTPVLDKPIDLEKIEQYGKEGVLCLVSDSLGSRTKGFVPSEKSLDQTFPEIFRRYEGKQLFITTISTNLSRMYQIIDAAMKVNRKVVPTGRSIDSSVKIARDLGYLPFPEDCFVDIKKAGDYNQRDIVYLISGCFGQPGSALERLSRGEHHDIFLDQGAIVVFSAEPSPPGVDVDVERVSSNFIECGAEVIDHTNMEHLHVSGHGHQDELSRIASLIKPKYFIPNGGTPVNLHAYANMVVAMGISRSNVFELREGEVVEFKNSNAKRGKTVEVKDLFYDGVSLSPVVIKDRELLATDGVFVVVVPIDKDSKEVSKVDVVTRGFVYVKESKALLGSSRDVVNKILEKNGKNINDWGSVKNKIEKEIQKYLYKQTGRNPLVIVHSIFV